MEKVTGLHTKGGIIALLANSRQLWNAVAYNGTACFYFFIDYRGRHRKGIAINNATEVS